MATYQENLVTIRDNLTAELAQIIARKPNYGIDGEGLQWQSLYDSSVARIADINALIQMGDGGFEIKTQGIT